MKNAKTRFEELLALYLQNRCSREEYEELIQLANNPALEDRLKELNVQEWSRHSQSDATQKDTLPTRNRTRMTRILTAIAATVAILIISTFVYLASLPKPNPIVYNTGNGEVKEITLPDGSNATLNANSTLTWIPVASKQKDRIVKLSGEAYFEVTKEAAPNSSGDYRGFQVVTPKLTIHVLGTSFNVFAREQNTEVFLEEGSVELKIPDVKQPTERMVPGQKITLDNSTGDIKKRESENISSSASWVTGVLNYTDKPMGEVLQSLSEIFGVEITCQDQNLTDKKINLGVPYMDWENTKRALEMAINVEFQKGDSSYLVVQNENH